MPTMRTSNFMEGSRPEDLLFSTAPLDPEATPHGHFVSQQAEFRFLVKLSINGNRATIFGIQDHETACRFADMAVLRFRKYMRPDTIKWNFSEQQATADTADDSERGGNLAKFLLARLEGELRKSGALIEPANLEPRTANNKPQHKEQRIDLLEQRIAALELHIDTLIERINNSHLIA